MSLSCCLPLPSSLQPQELSPHRYRLSTRVVPRGQRSEYWMDMICAMYVQLECDLPKESEVFGDIEFSRLGSLDLTQLRSNARRVRRTASHVSAAGSDYCLVQVQRDGRGVVRQDGRETVVNPGDFVMYDTSRPYELIFDGDHHDVLVLRLQRSRFDQHLANLEDLTATTVASAGAAGQLLLSMVETLRRDINLLHPSSAEGISDAITSIIVAGLRSLPGANARKPSNLNAYHLARIKAYVHERLRDPELSVAGIAHALKLSPDHVGRLFREEPMPLSRLVWQKRLDACRRDLVDPRLARRSVSDIAYSWGFNHPAHFSRSFRKTFGCSAREWRDQMARA